MGEDINKSMTNLDCPELGRRYETKRETETKKLLTASTALTLVAGAASAEVTFSGYRRFGLAYDSSVSKADNKAKAKISERLQLNSDVSKTTESGITFGGYTVCVGAPTNPTLASRRLTSTSNRAV